MADRRARGSTAARPSPLPAPEDRPDADVVIYDGQCAMCCAQMLKLTWWDCQDRLAYLSLHDPAVSERYPDLTSERLMREMVVVGRDGRRYGGAEALRRLSRRLRRLWWLAPLLHLPGSLPLWQFLYQQIAKRRYRFGKPEACTTEACQRHTRP